LPDLSDAEFETFAALPYPAYWSAFDPATYARHARLVREAERDHRDLTVATRVDAARSVTEITIYTGDHAGLFSQIAGALAVAGANIVDARIATMTNGMALDVFWVQDERGAPIDRSDRLARLSARIEQTLSGECRPSDELCKRGAIASRTGVFKVPPRVLIDNAASATHTVIEVNGRDRRGLLFDVTRALTGCGIQISSARIATYGESVIDVFYVKDIFGMKIYNDAKLAEIRKALLAVLADPGDRNVILSSSSMAI
jgi:[protein-PII] uridylyltransferase